MTKSEMRDLITDVLYNHIEDDEELAEAILDSLIECMDEEGVFDA